MAHSFDPLSFDIPHPNATDFVGSDTWHQSHLVPGDELLPHGTSNFARKLAGKHEYYPFLTDPEQVSLLRTFMEEVGPRLDIMDEMNHFSQILPGFAINPSYGDEKATHYYDAATRDLLNAVHDPNLEITAQAPGL
ncbi:hypothetical protein DTO012A8_10217 [Penicillium roqueforti]|nr:hypothetical protein DTO012A8_10217 [Penicillium roqueforti]